jgi:amidase
VSAPTRLPHDGGFFVPHDIAAPIPGAPAGPLAGLTAVVKDMYDIVGERTGGGSPEWLAAQRPATVHAAAVANILDAGATIVGKTVCDEFFYSVTGVNAHYGTPVNVNAPGRIPGGSSSGSAAATAAGLCDFALGSDTGGSVRVPAAFCGVYGIRPTHGRVDLSGAMPMAGTFDVVGWFARDPAVLRRVGGVLLEGEGVKDEIHRVIVADEALAEADPEIAALIGDALAGAEDTLPNPTHARITPDGLDRWREAFRLVQAREVWMNYGNFVEKNEPALGPGIKERMAFAASVTGNDAAVARAAQLAARVHLRLLLEPGTLLALPTAPTIAPRIETPTEELESFRVRVLRLTCIAGLSGLPQVTIPIGTVRDCPVGLSFIGWDGGDEVLLDLAAALAR